MLHLNVGTQEAFFSCPPCEHIERSEHISGRGNHFALETDRAPGPFGHSSFRKKMVGIPTSSATTLGLLRTPLRGTMQHLGHLMLP